MTSRFISRRELLRVAGGGIGSIALTDLLLSAPSNLTQRAPHFPAKAKAVISIFCYGGVSQVDTFDPKPELLKRQGEAMTGKGEVVVSQGNPGGLMPSHWQFKKHGQCGMDVSELYPHTAQLVDEIAFVRSMYAVSNDHAPALFQMNTGSPDTPAWEAGSPTAWVPPIKACRPSSCSPTRGGADRRGS